MGTLFRFEKRTKSTVSLIMTEITIEVSDDVKNLIEEIDERLYIEAIKDVAKFKLAEKQKELKYLKRKAAKFEIR